MRISITDEFLRELYNFMEKIGDNIPDIFTPKTFKEAFYPDWRRLRLEYEKRNNRKNFSQFVYDLKKRGLIKIKNLQNRRGVVLTPKGLDKILKTKLQATDKKKRPDKKWQMIIFDIPEKKRRLRDILRANLYLLGYEKIQQSVWISPYNVYKETEKILRYYSLDPYVRLFLIENTN